MDAQTVILFVPGLFGSRLVHPESKSTLWLKALDGIRNTRSLALSLDQEPSEIAGGILERVSILPPFYSVDVYGTFLKRLSRQFQATARVEVFDYDWRLAPFQVAPLLHQKLEAERERGAKQFHIIAHSMGGVIVSYYLRYGAASVEDAKETWTGVKDVEKVLFAAVPFKGTMAAFRDAISGVAIGLNRRLIDIGAYSSWRSTYVLLPNGELDTLFDAQGNRHVGRVRNFASWKENRWGLIGLPSSNDSLQSRERYTEECLRRGSIFLEKVHAEVKAPPPYLPRLLNVIGRGRPSQAAGVQIENRILFTPQQVKAAGLSFPMEKLFLEGDGTVPAASAELPKYLHAEKTLFSKLDHLQLLTSKTMQQELFEFLKS